MSVWGRRLRSQRFSRRRKDADRCSEVKLSGATRSNNAMLLVTLVDSWR